MGREVKEDVGMELRAPFKVVTVPSGHLGDNQMCGHHRENLRMATLSS